MCMQTDMLYDFLPAKPFFKNSFIEVRFIFHTVHPLIVYKVIGFDILHYESFKNHDKNIYNIKLAVLTIFLGI